MTHEEKILATAYTGVMFVDGNEIGEVYELEEKAYWKAIEEDYYKAMEE